MAGGGGADGWWGWVDELGDVGRCKGCFETPVTYCMRLLPSRHPLYSTRTQYGTRVRKYYYMHCPAPVLVPGHKYPKMEGDHSYGGTDTHGCFAIYFFNPCFRVLMAWDKYLEPSNTGYG